MNKLYVAPSISLQKCEYDKTRKMLKLPSEYIGMPSEFYLQSHHTNKVIRFKAVTQYDELFDEDGWDGEQMIYRPTVNLPNVKYMVIYHQY